MPLDLNKLEGLKHTLTANEIARLDLYVNEANFIYSLIEEDINVAPMNFYEIGSGIGLLSRMVAEKGHTVTATEPATSGFGVVKILQKVIEESFVTVLKAPIYYSATAEELFPKLQEKNISFDYVFCANVVEHVSDLNGFFGSIIPQLNESGRFRFICPNYLFPYEPHFGFISLPSKRLTRIIQNSRIKSSGIDKAEKFFEDLSFPNIFKLNKILRKYEICKRYDNLATKNYMKRAIEDEYFANRKRKVSYFISILPKHVEYFISMIPKIMLPVIDCQITKKIVNK
jgi:2-polyprenyl-3-methyl-5-hydroxy-6-metoxy-1,4-benzoquinol methylase